MKDGSAQRVAARYRVARLLKGKVVTKLWIVTDASPLSTMADILYETDPDELVNIILGTGGPLWRQEHTALHDDKASALADAKKRMALRDAEQAKKGLYPVERGGQVRWVTVPGKD
jgi:hypothetical protein